MNSASAVFTVEARTRDMKIGDSVKQLKYILVVACLLIFGRVGASELSLGGLLLDSTISRQGHEFASQLGQYWREVPSGTGKNLLVKEIVVPQAGTKLTVIYDNKTVYQTYMGRRQVPIEQRVQQAILQVLDAVANDDTKQRSPDLAEGEWE